MYKWLLHLYPADFRRRFVDEMSLDFDDGYAVACQRGHQALVSFIARCYGDLVRSLVMQWLRNASLIVSGASIVLALAMWAATFLVAAYEWPNGPFTTWFVWQLGIALTAGSVLTQGFLWINRFDNFGLRCSELEGEIERAIGTRPASR